jgi:hypothetical protein
VASFGSCVPELRLLRIDELLESVSFDCWLPEFRAAMTAEALA